MILVKIRMGSLAEDTLSEFVSQEVVGFTLLERNIVTIYTGLQQPLCFDWPEYAPWKSMIQNSLNKLERLGLIEMEATFSLEATPGWEIHLPLDQGFPFHLKTLLKSIRANSATGYLFTQTPLETITEKHQALEKYGGMVPLSNQQDLLWEGLDPGILPILKDHSQSLTASRYVWDYWVRKPNDGPVTRWLLRPISRIITKLLISIPMSPNLISLFAFLIATSAGAFWLFAGYGCLILGSALLFLSLLVDNLDGERARLQFRSSEFGGWLDAVLDRYADGWVTFALAWHCFQGEGEEWVWLVGFLAILGTFLNSYTADKYDGIMLRHFHRKYYLRLGRDVRGLMLIMGAITNFPLMSLILIALTMNLEVGRRIWLAFQYQDSKGKS